MLVRAEPMVKIPKPIVYILTRPKMSPNLPIRSRSTVLANT